MRQLVEAPDPPPSPAGVAVSEYVLPAGPTIRVLAPVAPAGPRPCLYWAHPGGYVLGNRFMDDDRLASWVRRLGCVATSIEYRVAPEHPYPAAIDDCWARLVWLHEHAGELGIDPRVRRGRPERRCRAGGGAGDACPCDRGGPRIAFQLLDSPMIDDRQLTPSSREEGLTVWDRESNRFGWASYLGEAVGTDAVEPDAAPARATDLGGMPPALVTVGGADGFRDEDVDYASRLSGAGVPTELRVYPGAPHGFVVFPAAVASRAERDVEGWLARQLGRAGYGGERLDAGVDGHLLHEFGMRAVEDPEALHDRQRVVVAEHDDVRRQAHPFRHRSQVAQRGQGVPVAGAAGRGHGGRDGDVLAAGQEVVAQLVGGPGDAGDVVDRARPFPAGVGAGQQGDHGRDDAEAGHRPPASAVTRRW